tara:strand:- start:828 stop:995 length:168 start_codon:yes stop_codon:yes gene_type:complete
MGNRIHIGVGGWTFEPWRGVFYPEGLVQKRELEFAARALTSIEQQCGVRHLVSAG